MGRKTDVSIRQYKHYSCFVYFWKIWKKPILGYYSRYEKFLKSQSKESNIDFEKLLYILGISLASRNQGQQFSVAQAS